MSINCPYFVWRFVVKFSKKTAIYSITHIKKRLKYKCSLKNSSNHIAIIHSKRENSLLCADHNNNQMASILVCNAISRRSDLSRKYIYLYDLVNILLHECEKKIQKKKNLLIVVERRILQIFFAGIYIPIQNALTYIHSVKNCAHSKSNQTKTNERTHTPTTKYTQQTPSNMANEKPSVYI